MTRPSLEGRRPLPPIEKPHPPHAANGKANGKPAARKVGSTSNRFPAFNEFVDVALRSLPPATGLVWVVLWRDERDGTATTSRRSLAERVGCSVATVKRSLRELEGAGLIEVARRGNRAVGPSSYVLYPRPNGGRP